MRRQYIVLDTKYTQDAVEVDRVLSKDMTEGKRTYKYKNQVWVVQIVDDVKRVIQIRESLWTCLVWDKDPALRNKKRSSSRGFWKGTMADVDEPDEYEWLEGKTLDELIEELLSGDDNDNDEGVLPGDPIAPPQGAPSDPKLVVVNRPNSKRAYYSRIVREDKNSYAEIKEPSLLLRDAPGPYVWYGLADREKLFGRDNYVELNWRGGYKTPYKSVMTWWLNFNGSTPIRTASAVSYAGRHWCEIRKRYFIWYIGPELNEDLGIWNIAEDEVEWMLRDYQVIEVQPPVLRLYEIQDDKPPTASGMPVVYSWKLPANFETKGGFFSPDGKKLLHRDLEGNVCESSLILTKSSLHESQWNKELRRGGGFTLSVGSPVVRIENFENEPANHTPPDPVFNSDLPPLERRYTTVNTPAHHDEWGRDWPAAAVQQEAGYTQSKVESVTIAFSSSGKTELIYAFGYDDSGIPRILKYTENVTVNNSGQHEGRWSNEVANEYEVTLNPCMAAATDQFATCCEIKPGHVDHPDQKPQIIQPYQEYNELYETSSINTGTKVVHVEFEVFGITLAEQETTYTYEEKKKTKYYEKLVDQRYFHFMGGPSGACCFAKQAVHNEENEWGGSSERDYASDVDNYGTWTLCHADFFKRLFVMRSINQGDMRTTEGSVNVYRTRWKELWNDGYGPGYAILSYDVPLNNTASYGPTWNGEGGGMITKILSGSGIYTVTEPRGSATSTTTQGLASGCAATTIDNKTTLLAYIRGNGEHELVEFPQYQHSEPDAKWTTPGKYNKNHMYLMELFIYP